MEQISVFDMLKIGVGPSSSHTLGPWVAAQRWLEVLKKENLLDKVEMVQVNLYGSLSLTGKGHATDTAVLLGLSGEDPVLIDVATIDRKIDSFFTHKTMSLAGVKNISFDPEVNIIFNQDFLPFHPNGITFAAYFEEDQPFIQTYYSIGGGFVIMENEEVGEYEHQQPLRYPYPIEKGKDLIQYCQDLNMSISEVVLENEKTERTVEEIEEKLMGVWQVMLDSMYQGCHTSGELPGLGVKRRAFGIHQQLIHGHHYHDISNWIETIRKLRVRFSEIFKWISCFSLGVNEVNASLGRIVTAPTNGSAGVIPAVLMYYLCFVNKFATRKEVFKFLLTAGEIGSIFKKGATISAAMGGCQAEIGVSSAMAAAALTEVLGGTPAQALAAAEIAMEHHLGLTCDPIGGLVQVPCIERNAMGAVKAINAAEIALASNPDDALISLDEIVASMWRTAQDMNHDYKETSTGGLAVTVGLADC